MQLAKEKWKHPKGRVLPVVIKETKIDDIPNYLKAVTLLEPKGNIPAEVAHEVEKMGKGWRRLGSTKAVLLILFLAFASLSIFVKRPDIVEKQPKQNLSRLEAEQILQSNRGNIEYCIRNIDEPRYLNFFFAPSATGSVNVDILLGEGKEITTANFWHTPLPGGVYNWNNLVSMLEKTKMRQPISSPPEDVDVSRRLYFASKNNPAIAGDQHGHVTVMEYGARLSVQYPEANRCIIDAVKDQLYKYEIQSPESSFLHKMIVDKSDK